MHKAYKDINCGDYFLTLFITIHTDHNTCRSSQNVNIGCLCKTGLLFGFGPFYDKFEILFEFKGTIMASTLDESSDIKLDAAGNIDTSKLEKSLQKALAFDVQYKQKDNMKK